MSVSGKPTSGGGAGEGLGRGAGCGGGGGLARVDPSAGGPFLLTTRRQEVLAAGFLDGNHFTQRALER